MVLLVEKLGRSLKFPSKLENRSLNSHTLSESLRTFRSKIWDFITQTLLNSEKESELQSCFQLIHTSNSAFAKLVVEIDYPMTRWGPKLAEEYLTYTINLMELLNAVNSSVSHLKLSHQSNIHLSKEFKFQRPLKVQEKAACDQESVLLQALILSNKIGFLALGFVVSGLCCDAKPYMDVRKFSGGFDDSVIKDLDSRLCREACDGELKVLENSIQIIGKQSDNLFSQVLSTRNKLLDNLRLSG